MTVVVILESNIFEHPQFFNMFTEDANKRNPMFKGQDVVIVSSNPYVSHVLTKMKIPFKDIHECYDNGVVTKVAMDGYSIVKKMCEEIDAAIPKGHAMEGAAMNNFFPLKMLYDAITTRIKIIEQIVENENAKHIAVFEKPSQRNFDPKHIYPYSSEDHVFYDISDVITKSGLCKMIRIVQLNKPLIDTEIKTRSKTRIPHFVSWIGQTYRTYGIVTAALSSINMAVNKARNKNLIMLPSESTEWIHTMPEILSSGYNVIPFTFSSLHIETHDINIKETSKKYCTIDKIDFSEEYNRKAKEIFMRYAISVGDARKSMNAMINEYDPVAILAHVKTPLEHSMAAEAISKGVPVVSWQHGASFYPYFGPMIPYNECMNSTVHISYGPKYRWCEKSVPIGSAKMEHLYETTKNTKEDIDVLYTTTSYAQGTSYLNAIPLLQDTAFWVMQQEIMDNIPRGSNVIKLHPITSETSHIKEYALKKGISVVVGEQTYESLAARSKTIIVDWPSTTFLMALAMRKKTILISNIRFTSEQNEMIDKSAYHSDDARDIPRFIRSHDLKGDYFIREYGIYKTGVKKEVIKLLESITHNQQDHHEQSLDLLKEY
jgi:hypothetical protein